MADKQTPGIYHRKIGDILVTAISDGFIDAPYGVLQSIGEKEAEQILEASFQIVPPRISVNCYVVRSAGKIAIIDTGSGDTMGPTLGQMPSFLELINIKPKDIDSVLLTHMHPDHSNGLLDSKGNIFFENAEIIVSERDVAHWHDDSAMAKANDSQRERYFKEARRQIAPYMQRRKNALGEVVPGVHAVDLSGHTPGHTGYIIESGQHSLLVWGDICHVPDIQIRKPEVTMVFDTDPEAAILARRRTFDMVSNDRVLVAGMHLHFPGFCYVTRENSSYHILPESWNFEI